MTNIQDIIPFIKDGYVAMDKNGDWHWFIRKPYHNNNCIGCFKAGKGYWNKIRIDFPEVFNATSEVEISTKHTVLKENGKPLYLKDLKPNEGYHTDLDIPDCGLFCDLEVEGLPILELEEARKELLNVN